MMRRSHMTCDFEFMEDSMQRNLTFLSLAAIVCLAGACTHKNKEPENNKPQVEAKSPGGTAGGSASSTSSSSAVAGGMCDDPSSEVSASAEIHAKDLKRASGQWVLLSQSVFSETKTL